MESKKSICICNTLQAASADLGTVKRRRNGKLRHVKIGMVWIQEKQEPGYLEYSKVFGLNNPADLMTTNLGESHSRTLQVSFGTYRRADRAEQRLTLDSGAFSLFFRKTYFPNLHSDLTDISGTSSQFPQQRLSLEVVGCISTFWDI